MIDACQLSSMIPLSHHSSNPLEAGSSDPLNRSYNKQYHAVALPTSDDPLGRYDAPGFDYPAHVDQIITERNASLNITPKKAAAFKKFIEDADEQMRSDDELATGVVYEDNTPFLARMKREKSEFKFSQEMKKTTVILEDSDLVQEPIKDDDEEMRDTATPTNRVLSSPLSSAPTSPQLPQPLSPAPATNPSDISQLVFPDTQSGILVEYEEEAVDGDELNTFEGYGEAELNPQEGDYEQEERYEEAEYQLGIENEDDDGIDLDSDDADSLNIQHYSSSRPTSPTRPSSSLSQKSPDERNEIAREIQELCALMPNLAEDYELVDRLGTGTFSSVYKAIDLRYSEWDNHTWKGSHPEDSSAHYQSAGPEYKGRGGRGRWRKRAAEDEGMDVDDAKKDGKVYVAIKRIYTTSGPERIRNELSILETCRGCRHTSQIITAFRHLDQVVIILPYQRNKDFREFFATLHMEGVKAYFRCLFRALRDIHARRIIHRDVKPANFLFDPFTGIGTLCDFGLASIMEEGNNWPGMCLHTGATAAAPHGRTRPLNPDMTRTIKAAQRDARTKSEWEAEKVGWLQNDKRPPSKANRAGTRGFRAPEVLFKCSSQTGAVDVWSAGVILLFFLCGKYPLFQSNSDVEGLMEIAVIIGKDNLEKAATLHSRTIATNVPSINKDGIKWQTFVEQLHPDVWTPKECDLRFYPHNSKHQDGRDLDKTAPPPAAPAPDRPFDPSASSLAEPLNEEKARDLARHRKDVKNAFQLLESVLHPLSNRRFTPAEALNHPFLLEPGLEDDKFIPRLVGEGVCGKYHARDEVGGHVVKIKVKCLCLRKGGEGHVSGRVEAYGDDGWGGFDDDEEEEDELQGFEGEEGDEGQFWCGEYIWRARSIETGQGIPIGASPCEFHRNLEF